MLRWAIPSRKDSSPSCEDHLLTPSGPPRLELRPCSTHSSFTQWLRQNVVQALSHFLSTGTSPMRNLYSEALHWAGRDFVRSSLPSGNSCCPILFLPKYYFPRYFVILTLGWHLLPRETNHHSFCFIWGNALLGIKLGSNKYVNKWANKWMLALALSSHGYSSQACILSVFFHWAALPSAG